MEIMKVSSNSSSSSVAGALSSMIRNKESITIQVIGAAALNQAMKAIAITRGYVVPTGIEIACIPAFHDLTIDDKIVTAIRIKIVIL